MSAPAGSATVSSARARLSITVLVAAYLLVELAAGVPSSPLVPPLPAGVHVPGWAGRGAAFLGFDRLSRGGLTALAVGLLAVAVLAFLILAREAWRGRVRLRTVLLGAAAALALAVAGPLLLSRDVHSYAAYGRMLAVHGANPYRLAPSAFPQDPFTPVVSREWIDTRSVYGPAFTWVSAGIAKAWAGSPAATILVFKVLAGMAAAAATAFAAGAARGVRPDRVPAAAAVVGLNPVVVVQTVGGGHSDALVAALLAAALALAVIERRRSPAEHGGWSAPRPFAVTALLTCAALVKVVAALPLLVWLWSLARGAPPRRRARTALAHAGLAAVLATAVTAPLFAGRATFTAIANLASRQGWASAARLVARVAEGLGRTVAGHTVGSGLGAVAYAAFVLAFILVLVSVLHRARPDRAGANWGLTMLAFALSAPYLLPWYAAWFVPFVALLEDATLAWVAIVACSALALTGVPAEPAGGAALYRGMLLLVHYAVAPVVLALFTVTVARASALLRPERADRPGRARTPSPAAPPP